MPIFVNLQKGYFSNNIFLTLKQVDSPEMFIKVIYIFIQHILDSVDFLSGTHFLYLYFRLTLLLHVHTE